MSNPLPGARNAGGFAPLDSLLSAIESTMEAVSDSVQGIVADVTPAAEKARDFIIKHFQGWIETGGDGDFRDPGPAGTDRGGITPNDFDPSKPSGNPADRVSTTPGKNTSPPSSDTKTRESMIPSMGLIALGVAGTIATVLALRR